MDLQERVRELSLLNAIADTLNLEADFSKALEQSIQKIKDALNLSTVWVFITNLDSGNSHKGRFYLALYSELPPALKEHKQRPLCEGSCECQGMFARGELDRGVNMVTCSRLKYAKEDTKGLTRHASIPLLSPNGPVGIINLATKSSEQFSQTTLGFLDAVGRQLGSAFERSRLEKARTQEARYAATLEERERLAREMHDSVAQLLFAADLSLDTSQAAQDQKKRTKSILTAQTAVKTALAELRSMVELMRPAELSGGLKAALVRLVNRTANKADIHLEVSAPNLPERFETALYRICQEALHNALRHADADNIWITLEHTHQTLTLTVKDDGKGMNSDAARGLGITNMQERTASLGGSFDIATGSEGLVLRVKIPLAL